jgi:hypothetical protein
MEIHSVGAAWIHAGRQLDGRTGGRTDGRVDMKITGAFRDDTHVLMESKEF